MDLAVAFDVIFETALAQARLVLQFFAKPGEVVACRFLRPFAARKG